MAGNLSEGDQSRKRRQSLCYNAALYKAATGRNHGGH